MPDSPIFIGYYTPGPYEREAAGLIYSLEALGLEHDIFCLADQGGWQRNTQAKASVVAAKLDEHRGRRVVYLDVDAYVISRPMIFWALSCDFAAHLWDRSELLGGTLYFRANDTARQLVARWQRVCERFPDTLPDGRPAWDQRCLLRAMREMQADGEALEFHDLPHSYCWMIGLSQRERPNERPVILHKEGDAAWKSKPIYRRRGGLWVTEAAKR